MSRVRHYLRSRSIYVLIVAASVLVGYLVTGELLPGFAIGVLAGAVVLIVFDAIRAARRSRKGPVQEPAPRYGEESSDRGSSNARDQG